MTQLRREVRSEGGTGIVAVAGQELVASWRYDYIQVVHVSDTARGPTRIDGLREKQTWMVSVPRIYADALPKSVQAGAKTTLRIGRGANEFVYFHGRYDVEPGTVALLFGG